MELSWANVRKDKFEKERSRWNVKIERDGKNTQCDLSGWPKFRSTMIGIPDSNLGKESIQVNVLRKLQPVSV